METLNQANPFFVRCIKSNAEKVSCFLLVVFFMLDDVFVSCCATIPRGCGTVLAIHPSVQPMCMHHSELEVAI